MRNQVGPSVVLHVTPHGTPSGTPLQTPRRSPRRTAGIEFCITPQEKPEKDS